MVSEAHLPPARRSVGLVRYVRGKRRSAMGWTLFLGLIALNELRGLYVVSQVWRHFIG